MPQRIQRQRTKGWRMPEGAVYVGRPSRWGNPFRVSRAMDLGYVDFTVDDARKLVVDSLASVLRAGRRSEFWFANGAERFDWMTANLGALKGKDLACWCPLDQPCHADVLLEIANGVSAEDRQAIAADSRFVDTEDARTRYVDSQEDA